MPEWLLTDEEIEGFKLKAARLANEWASSTEGHFTQKNIEDIYMDADKAMLEAQAKKLAEWLFGRCEHLCVEQSRWECVLCLRILRKEVGLEAKE